MHFGSVSGAASIQLNWWIGSLSWLCLKSFHLFSNPSIIASLCLPAKQPDISPRQFPYLAGEWFFFQQPTISKETHSKPYLHLSWRTAPLSKGAINEKLECRWTNSLTRSIKELVRGESQLGAGDWAINRTLDVSRWPAGRRSDIIIPCAIPPPPIPTPYHH